MQNEFTTGQVAKICKVSPRTVNKWFDSGRLRGFRTPANIRCVPRVNLIQFLQEHHMPLGPLSADFAPARRRAAHHRRRARILMQQRDYEQAIAELDQAIEHYAERRALYLRGLAHFRMGEHEKALADLTSARGSDWGRARRVCYLLALIRYRRGEYSAAMQEVDWEIRCNSRHAAAYRLRARLHRLLA